MNRRNFLSSLGASLAAMFVGKLPSAKAGVPGVTYFNAPNDIYPPDGMHVYLDGRDVHCESFEADLVQGWVESYQVAERHPDGTCKSFVGPPDEGWRLLKSGDDFSKWNTPSRRHHGTVELRPRTFESETESLMRKIARDLDELSKTN